MPEKAQRQQFYELCAFVELIVSQDDTWTAGYYLDNHQLSLRMDPKRVAKIYNHFCGRVAVQLPHLKEYVKWMKHEWPAYFKGYEYCYEVIFDVDDVLNIEIYNARNLRQRMIEIFWERLQTDDPHLYAELYEESDDPIVEIDAMLFGGYRLWI